MDIKKFKRKYFLAILASPIMLLPFVGGVICVAGAAIFESVSLGLVGTVSMLSSVGTFVYRFLISPSEKIARKAQEEIEKEDVEAREAALNELGKQLKLTKGTIDEDALKDLRALVKVFKESQSWKNNINVQSAFEMVSTVDQIFKECIRKLKTSLDLYYEAGKTPSEKVRRAILKNRENVIKSVQASVEHLSQTFEKIQELGLSSEKQDVRLSNLGKELLQQLELAKQADQIEKSLKEGLSLDDVLKEPFKEYE